MAYAMSDPMACAMKDHMAQARAHATNAGCRELVKSRVKKPGDSNDADTKAHWKEPDEAAIQ